MSLDALNWAMVQKAGSPAAKTVLIILARYANQDGWAWPSRRTLADATEQSPDSVDRALRLLIERRLIEKGAAQHRDDGGKSTVRYRILVDLRRMKADLQHNRAKPGGRYNEQPEDDPEEVAVPPDPMPQIAGRGMPQIAGTHAANLRHGDAADCGTSHERKDSSLGIEPPSPPGRGALSGSNPDRDKGDTGHRQGEVGTTRRPRSGAGCREAAAPALAPDATARFQRLWATYPASGRSTIGPATAAAPFARLAPAEQEVAIRAAVTCAATTPAGSQAKRLDRWLAEGHWRNGELAFGGTAGPAAAATASARVWVGVDTPEWEAWDRHLRATTGKGSPQRDGPGGLGWTFPSKWPPASEVA